MFTEFILDGQEPGCYGERCKFCFIISLCADLHNLRKKGKIEAYAAAACLKEKNVKSELLLQDILSGEKVDFIKFVDFHIKHRYFAKKIDCEQCAKKVDCKGVPVERIKKEGFAVLKPIKNK